MEKVSFESEVKNSGGDGTVRVVMMGEMKITRPPVANKNVQYCERQKIDSFKRNNKIRGHKNSVIPPSGFWFLVAHNNEGLDTPLNP